MKMLMLAVVWFGSWAFGSKGKQYIIEMASSLIQLGIKSLAGALPPFLGSEGLVIKYVVEIG